MFKRARLLHRTALIAFDGSQYVLADATVAHTDTYFYTVTVSGSSAGIQSGTVAPTGPVPVRALHLDATVSGSDGADVFWTGDAGADSVDLTRTSSDGTLAHVSAESQTSGLPEGATFTYSVSAEWPDGTSATSNSESVTLPVRKPTGLNVISVASNEVDLNWTDNSALSPTFDLTRLNTQTHVSDLFHLPAGTTTYADTSVGDGTTYRYTVVAIYKGVTTDASNTVEATTPLFSPDHLIAEAFRADEIDLSWASYPGSHAAVDYVYGGTDPGNLTLLAEVPVVQGSTTPMTFAHTGLQPGIEYWYMVLALPRELQTAYRAPVSAWTLPLPPANFTDQIISTTRVDLSWVNVTAGTQIEVNRAPAGTYDFSTLQILAAGTTSYSDLSITEGASYEYEIRACAGGGYSPYVLSDTVVTPLLAPTQFTAASAGTNEIDLSWSNPSSVAGAFAISRSTDGQTWTPLATVTGLAYHDLSAAEGTAYFYQIQAQAFGLLSPAATAQAATPALAPAGLTATWNGAEIDLAWTDNSAASPTFQLTRTDGQNHHVVTLIAAGDISYVDATAVELTDYTYSLRAIGNNVASAATTVAVAGALFNPTGLTAMAASPTRVNLAWTNNTLVSPYVDVRRSTDGTNFTSITDPPIIGDTFADTSASAGVHYWYQVAAVPPTNLAAFAPADSNVAEAWSVPAIPQGLGAMPLASNQVQLDWTTVAAGASLVLIQRSDDGGLTYADLDSVDGSTATYIDSTVLGGVNYCYRILAQTPDGTESTPSDPVSAQTVTGGVTNLAAAEVSPSEIDLSWTTLVTDATGFNVLRSTDGQTYTPVSASGQLAAGATGFVDTGLQSNTRYWYQVQAIEPAGPGGVTAVDAYTLPTAPSGLTASANADGSISLAWSNASGAGTPMIVETSDSATGDYSFLDSAAAGASSYSGAGVVDGASTFYRVVAESGDSAGGSPSNSARIDAPLSPPSDLEATSLGTSEIDLAWSDNSVTATSYVIQRSDPSGGGFTQVGTVGAGSDPTYADTTVEPGTAYSYRILAASDSATSEPSGTASATTDPTDRHRRR